MLACKYGVLRNHLWLIKPKFFAVDSLGCPGRRLCLAKYTRIQPQPDHHNGHWYQCPISDPRSAPDSQDACRYRAKARKPAPRVSMSPPHLISHARALRKLHQYAHETLRLSAEFWPAASRLQGAKPLANELAFRGVIVQGKSGCKPGGLVANRPLPGFGAHLRASGAHYGASRDAPMPSPRATTPRLRGPPRRSTPLPSIHLTHCTIAPPRHCGRPCRPSSRTRPAAAHRYPTADRRRPRSGRPPSRAPTRRSGPSAQSHRH
jgi:hypothetical protein